MSRTHFRVNPHSIVAWMSSNSLLEAGSKSEGEVAVISEHFCGWSISHFVFPWCKCVEGHPPLLMSLFPSVFLSVCRAPYLRNQTSSNHNVRYTCVKWWYLQVFFSFFFFFFFFLIFLKNPKRKKKNKIRPAPYLRSSIA